VDRLVFTLLLILVNFSYAQLPEDYALLIRFKNQDDLYAGEQILKKYPNAVFINDLKLLMAEKYYEMGNKKGLPSL